MPRLLILQVSSEIDPLFLSFRLAPFNNVNSDKLGGE